MFKTLYVQKSLLHKQNLQKTSEISNLHFASRLNIQVD